MSRKTQTSRRAKSDPSRLLLACVASLTIWSLPSASAQSLYVTANRTLAGGNPINGNFALVQIGLDAGQTVYPNLVADITGGTVNQYVNALYGSTVNISGGTIGTAPSNSTYLTAVNVALGSTVNMSGGTLLSFVNVRGSSAGGPTNGFNLTGGSVNAFIANENDGTVQISGGTVGDYTANYGSGTINVTGGSLATLVGYNFNGSGGMINFGGTASVNSIFSAGGTANISGGVIGSGGVTVRNSGVANFTGTGLTVTQVSTAPVFDDNDYLNLIVSQYTIAGTLANGAAVHTTVNAGESFSNSGSLATFNAPALAPDLYVTTNQTVTGVYNNVNVGIDDTLSIPSSPTATLAAGTDTVFLTTYSQSITHMTGGIVRGFIYVSDQSHFSMSGGEAPGGIDSDPGTTLNISGGATSYLGVGGSATISGGAIDLIDLHGGSTLVVQGTGLTTTGTAGHFWDPNSGTNYVSAGNFEVTGTLSDGTPFDQSVIASGASGTVSEQTIAGPKAASNLYATANVTTNTIYNQVSIGTNLEGTANTSPTVTFGSDTDTGVVYLRNQSTLNVQGGVVHGTIYADAGANLNISDGTVASVFQSPSGGTGKITVTGGATTYIAPANQMLMTGGQLGTLDTYGGAHVRVEGGSITQMLLYGGSASNPTTVVITGGSIGIIDFKGPGNITTILGGSVDEIRGAGGSAYIYGGTIGADTLLNFRANATLFDIFGQNLSLSDASLGTYTDGFGTTYTGVWWDVSGTLDSGTALSTRYFERNGTLAGPASLVFNVAVPEPGTASALAVVPALGLVRRRKCKV